MGWVVLEEEKEVGAANGGERRERRRGERERMRQDTSFLSSRPPARALTFLKGGVGVLTQS